MIHDEFRSYARLCKEQINKLAEYDKEVAKVRIENNIEETQNNLNEEPCILLIQQLLKKYPSFESKKYLYNLLLNVKYQIEMKEGE